MKKLSYVLLSGLFLSACTQTEEVKDVKSDVTKDSTEVTAETEPIVEEEAKLVLTNFEDYAKLDTREKVIAHFGAENISNGTSWYGEGSMSYPHSVVTNKETGHIVKYLWQEEDSNKLYFMEANYKSYDKDYKVTGTQNLPSVTGIRVGMPIKELLTWNENKEIKFSGFAWDFHGMVHNSEDGSKLQKCGLRVVMDENAAEGLSGDMMGDVTLSTSDENVLSAPIVVGQLTYSIPE